MSIKATPESQELSKILFNKNNKTMTTHEIEMPGLPEGYEAITLNAGDEYGNPLTILIKLQKEEPEPPK